jgi:U4/U6.U5 tri-snRNP-associated protein 3
MNRRDQDRGRRPPKRSRSPDERERSPRDEKRRRSYANDSRRERSVSPRQSRSSQINGRAERHARREERRDPDRSRDRDRDRERSRGIYLPCYLFDQDEPPRKERDRRPPAPREKEEPEKRPTEQKPPPVEEVAIKPPSKPVPIVATSLLDEDDPPISQLMGFSRFSSTKGKKHVDYGGVETHKVRKYRQYMNRPGGFNRPLDPFALVP